MNNKRNFYVFLFIITPYIIYAQVPIQYYDFENNSARTNGETSAEFIVNSISGSEISSSGGSLSSVSGNPSSGSAQQRSEWSNVGGNPGVNTSNYIEFKVNSSGFSGLSIGIDAVSDLPNLDSLALIYSTDGSTFIIAGSKPLTTSFSTLNWDISSITSLNNISSVTFRLYAFGTAVTTGTENLTIDNLTVYANTIISTKSLPDYSAIDNANGSSPFPTFGNLNINGSGIEATLSSNLQLNGILSLNNGNIVTGTNTLTLYSSASISGGSSSSYVNGNLAWYFTGDLTKNFPIGNSSAYRQIEVTTAFLTDSGTIQAKVTDSNPGFTSLPSGVNSISSVRYWSLTLGNGISFDAFNGLYGVKIYWGPDDGVTDTSTITVVKGTAGGSWTEASNSGKSGNNSSGWVFGSFNSPVSSDFVLGDTGTNPLPVELYPITYKIINDRNIELNWVTATEINTFKFEVERKNLSLNQTDWQKIGEVKAAGNSNSPKAYSFIDKHPQPAKYNYRLKVIDINGSITYSNIIFTNFSKPAKFSIGQNYPNPFNPCTKIEYLLPAESKVALRIYNLLGQEIKELVNNSQSAGYHEIIFNANNLSSGIYFYRIEVNSPDGETIFSESKKMILTK